MIKILILSIIVSLIFFELTDLTPGGLIIPGLLLTQISNPIRLVYTIVIAIITYFIVKLLSNKLAVYGKRRFGLMILISFGLNIIINLIMGLFITSSNNFLFNLVGYTCAGIIASNYFRQGIIKTTLSMGIVMGITEVLIIVFTSVGIFN